jgi:hypothetical protein
MTSVSPHLAKLIASLIDDSTMPAAATLADMRALLIDDGVFVSPEGELLHPQDRTSVVIELDELIDAHGARAPARDFGAR